MLSVSDKSDSINDRIQENSELMKLHIQGVCQMHIHLLGYWLIIADVTMFHTVGP